MEETDQGFLITCDKHKEKQAIKESYNFLSEYIEEEYGDLENELIKQQLQKQGKQMNLENELKAMNRTKQNRLLSTIETNVNCLIFIKINKQFAKISPYGVVAKIMEDVHRNGKEVTRFCHKIMPVEKAFKAEHFRMLDLLRDMFEARKNTEMKSWALNFKLRNNSKFNYKQILAETEAIAKSYGHFVDIYYPEWTVSIEIANHLMCLSIVENYKEYEEFRLHKKAPNLKALIPKSEGNKDEKNKKERIQDKKMKKKEEREQQEEREADIEKKEDKNEEFSQKQQKNKMLLMEKIEVNDDDDVDLI